MKKILFVLGIILFTPLFGQNRERALDIIACGVDTSYIEKENFRVQEFSLTPRKYYKVMDLMESDSTCDCIFIKGHRNYIRYVKLNYEGGIKREFDKHVIGMMDCVFKDEFFVTMWMFDNEAFGFTDSPVLDWVKE